MPFLNRNIGPGLCWCWCLAMLAVPLSAQPVLRVGGGQPPPALEGHVSYLVDSAHAATPLALPADAAWQPFEHPAMNWGSSSVAVWLRFGLDNQSGEPVYLQFDYAPLDSLELWVWQGDSLAKHCRTGAHLPFATRDLPTTKPSFGLPPGQSAVYVKLSGRLNLQVAPSLYEAPQFMAATTRNDFVQGIYLGLVLLAILSSLLIGAMVRDEVFFAYVGHLIGTAFITMHLGGYTLQYVWPDHPLLSRYEPWIFGLGIFSTLFAMSFLRSAQVAPRLHRVFWFFVIVNALVFPLAFSGQVVLANQLVQMVGLFGCLFMLYAGVYLYWKDYKPARFFVLAWAVFLLGVVVTILQRVGLLPYTVLTLHASQIGSALDVVLLSLALADRVNLLRLENTLRQRQLVAVAKENERLVTAQNQRLASEVAARTADLKDKNEHLQQLADKQNTLLSIIGHDLRGPVGAIGQALELIEDEPELFTPDMVNMLGVTARNAHHLLENLLTWARAMRGDIDVDIRPLSLRDLVRDSMELLRLSAEQKQIDLVVEEGDGALRVMADEGHAATVLRNLLNNAIKFTPKGGRIVLRLYAEAGQPHLDVEDSGVGMPQERLGQLFDVQKSKSTLGTGGEAGTGLGLVLCKEFMDMMGGSIRVRSFVGEGTCFTLAFRG